MRVVADRLLYLFSGVGVGRSSIKRENPAIIGSWRTRRMARRKRNVSDLPYAAPPLSCVAFFFKVQKTEIYKEEIEYEVKRQFTAVYFLRRFLLDDLVEHR